MKSLKINIVVITGLLMVFILGGFEQTQAQVIFGAEEEIIPKLGDTIREYYSNPKSISRIKFRNEKILTIVEFSETRKKKTSTTFPLTDLKNKTVTQYHENGKVRLIATYVKGFASGPMKKFHENGQLAEMGAYDKISKDGEWLYYDPSGKLVKKEFYEKGKLIAVPN